MSERGASEVGEGQAGPSAPKPEMLEKAAKLHGDMFGGCPCPRGLECRTCKAVALALEGAANVRDEGWDRLLAMERSFSLARHEEIAEALRASEAALAEANRNELKLMARIGTLTAKLESSRAEATKADELLKEWHLKLCTCGGARSWPNGTYAASCLACGRMNAAIRAPRPECNHCRSGNKPVIGPNGYLWHEFSCDDPEQCLAPSSPTPPTSPSHAFVAGRGPTSDDYQNCGFCGEETDAHTAKVINAAVGSAHQPPTPPSEEPR